MTFRVHLENEANTLPSYAARLGSTWLRGVLPPGPQKCICCRGDPPLENFIPFCPSPVSFRQGGCLPSTNLEPPHPPPTRPSSASMKQWSLPSTLPDLQQWSHQGSSTCNLLLQSPPWTSFPRHINKATATTISTIRKGFLVTKLFRYSCFSHSSPPSPPPITINNTVWRLCSITYSFFQHSIIALMTVFYPSCADNAIHLRLLSARPLRGDRKPLVTWLQNTHP